MTFLQKEVKVSASCVCVFGYLEADHPHQLSSKFCRAYEEMLASRSKGNFKKDTKYFAENVMSLMSHFYSF